MALEIPLGLRLDAAVFGGFLLLLFFLAFVRFRRSADETADAAYRGVLWLSFWLAGSLVLRALGIV